MTSQHNDSQHNGSQQSDTQHKRLVCDTYHKCVSIMTVSIMAHSIEGLFAKLSIKCLKNNQHDGTLNCECQHNDTYHNTQHNNDLSLCCVSCSIYCHAVCCYAECHYAECHYAECCGAVKFDPCSETSSQHLIFFVTYKWAQ